MAGRMGSAGRKKRGGRRYIQLFHNVKRSRAYHSLSVYARAALFEILERYTGVNNGMIGLGCRELAEALNCSRDRAWKALIELDDSGLVRPLTGGVWRGKKATEWRLTFKRCDKTGEPPILNWEPHSQSVQKDTKVRVEGHKAPLSPSRRTQEPKNPISEVPVSPSGRTHIDIYQGDTELVTSSGVVTLRPSAEPLKQAPTNFGPSEARIRALDRWGANAQRKPWSKPTILLDEPRDFAAYPLDHQERLAS